MQLFYDHRYPRRRLKNNPGLKNSASWNKTFARFAHRRHLKIISLLKKSRIYISSICCWLQISPICHLFKSSSSSGGSAKTNAVGWSGKSGSIEHQYTVPINGFWKRKNWRWARKPPPRLTCMWPILAGWWTPAWSSKNIQIESTVRKFNSFTHFYHMSFFLWLDLPNFALNSLLSFVELTNAVVSAAWFLHFVFVMFFSMFGPTRWNGGRHWKLIGGSFTHYFHRSTFKTSFYKGKRMGGGKAK